MAKKRVKKVSRKNKPKVARNKISLVIRQLLLFTGLFAVFFILFKIAKNAFWLRFTQIMSIVFAFVAVGFLIALLVLWIMKVAKK
jgi:hypothetical protein